MTSINVATVARRWFMMPMIRAMGPPVCLARIIH